MKEREMLMSLINAVDGLHQGQKVINTAVNQLERTLEEIQKDVNTIRLETSLNVTGEDVDFILSKINELERKIHRIKGYCIIRHLWAGQIHGLSLFYV